MRQFIIPRRPPGLAGFFISQNNPCGKSFGLSTAGAFSIPKRRFPHASVSCPLLHPLWPYPLRLDMYQALPGCVGGLVKNRNITLRAEGLRLEAWMRGHQIAWIRTHDLHWIAVVQVEAQSENEMSSVTMTLWGLLHE